MRLLTSVCTLLICTSLAATPNILPMRERAAAIDLMLSDRLSNLLPSLMRREGIDMWVLVSREYNDDPILQTLLPATRLSSQGRTMLILFDAGKSSGVGSGVGSEIESLALPDTLNDASRQTWQAGASPQQWQRLAEIIRQRRPSKIAINKSESVALADGIGATDYQALKSALGDRMAGKLVSAEPLAVAWLETRSALEMQYYPTLAALGHDVIAEAFSNRVVVPGRTSTDDVVWWLREKIRALKLHNWFHPTVSVQRADEAARNLQQSFTGRADNQIIQSGDLLHLDLGMTYLRLHSDQQQHAYVLKPGETDAPAYLKTALVNANRLQDILLSNFKVGRTGNEILNMSLQQAFADGLTPTINTHPVGFHGQGAGTRIGRWTVQDGVAVSGERALRAHTTYSLEVTASTFIPQWNRDVHIRLGETVFFDGRKVSYLNGRQTRFHLIRTLR